MTDDRGVRDGADAAPVLELLDEEPVSDLSPRLPSAQQMATVLAMLALVGPSALGGMPVLPVTIDDQRRRHQEQMQQQSESNVGVYQDAREAETALALSQRRLAQVTREVTRDPSRVVSEADVVRAAHSVLAGEVGPRQSQRFRSALGRVANDSVDLFILDADESARDRRQQADEPEPDLEAWLAEFE